MYSGSAEKLNWTEKYVIIMIKLLEVEGKIIYTELLFL